MPDASLDELCVDTLRFLAVDAVQWANNGHLGNANGWGGHGLHFVRSLHPLARQTEVDTGQGR